MTSYGRVGGPPFFAARAGSGWRAYGLAALFGVLAALTLPPFTLVPLIFVAIPGLLWLIGRSRGWAGAAARGLVFGIAHHMAGLYWVTNAILVRAQEFWWAVPIAVPLLATVLAVFIAVPCGVARLVPAGGRRILVLAGGWVAGDLARQFVLSGFPWNLLGSIWEMPGTLGLAFMQPASWVGVHGLTLATLLVAGVVTLGWRGRVAAFALVAAWGFAGAALLRANAPPTGITAVIVQPDVAESDHHAHGMERAWAEKTFDDLLALIRSGVAQAGGGPTLVVAPETASPYALAQDPGARQALAQAAAPARITLSGTERFESTTVAHNSLAAVAPDGSLAAIYDKAHLVPFGEYFPSYAHFLLGEQGFAPGPGVRTLHLPGVPSIGPLICYEAIFPAQVVNQADRPALLVNITNDAWFGLSAGPRQHLAAARMRAVEEGLPMLRAANTGISAVIDAHGRVVARLGLNRAGVLVAAVPGALPRTLAASLGLLAPASLAALCLGIGAARRGRRGE